MCYNIFGFLMLLLTVYIWKEGIYSACEIESGSDQMMLSTCISSRLSFESPWVCIIEIIALIINPLLIGSLISFTVFYDIDFFAFRILNWRDNWSWLLFNSKSLSPSFISISIDSQLHSDISFILFFKACQKSFSSFIFSSSMTFLDFLNNYIFISWCIWVSFNLFDDFLFSNILLFSFFYFLLFHINPIFFIIWLFFVFLLFFVMMMLLGDSLFFLNFCLTILFS